MRENFKITDKETGKEYWISRSMAVTGIIMSVDKNNNLYFLVEKRGPGCPDFVGYYCNPCGYLSWDETLAEAVVREIFEETGVDVSKDEKYLWNIMDDPKDNSRQNVTVRYIIYHDYEDLKKRVYDLSSDQRGGEEGEVSEILLISANDIDKYSWAWNHGELLRELKEVSDKVSRE